MALDDVIPPATPPALVETTRFFESIEGALVGFSFKEGRDACVLGPLVEAKGEKPGSRWAVAILAEGISANKRFYSAAVVAKAAPLFEGARCYWNHVADDAVSMRDPRDIAGVFKEARAAKVDGKTTIVAELHLVSAKAREFLTECFESGNPNVAGLSITAEGRGEYVKMAEGTVLRVDEITRAKSADIVSEPAAGGRFLRLVAGGASTKTFEEGAAVMDKKILFLKESRPDLHKLLSSTPTETEVDALIRVAEAVPAAFEKKDPPAAPAKGKEDDEKDGEKMSEAMRKVLGLEDEGDVALFRQSVVEAKVERALSGRTLLKEAADETRATVKLLLEHGASTDKIKSYVDGAVAAQAKIAEAQLGVVGGGHGMPRIDLGVDAVDKVTRAWDGFFANKDVKEGSTSFARFKSLREGYIQTTGDREVTGRLSESAMRRFAGITLLEGTREERTLGMTEAISTAGFANVLASSLNRQLVRDYHAETSLYGDTGKDWLYTVVPANDFRNRVRVRFGGYGNLPAVAEQGTYQPLAEPTDEGATYAVTKRGGLETLTFEAIKNDDVGFAQRIPQRLAMAAVRTHYEFIHNFYITNAAIYDNNNLFDAVNHQSNLAAVALSKATFSAARQAVLKMQEMSSNKRIGLTLRHLMVPIELQETAVNMFLMLAQAGIGGANYEPDFLAKVAKSQVHVIAHATDANDWFACVGADQCEQIEMGYLDGREDPEIFVADLPNAGSLFFSDKIDYKIRHIYGGAVLDYRGFYGSIVA